MYYVVLCGWYFAKLISISRWLRVICSFIHNFYTFSLSVGMDGSCINMYSYRWMAIYSTLCSVRLNWIVPLCSPPLPAVVNRSEAVSVNIRRERLGFQGCFRCCASVENRLSAHRLMTRLKRCTASQTRWFDTPWESQSSARRSGRLLKGLQGVWVG